jgi:hypothetical protein
MRDAVSGKLMFEALGSPGQADVLDVARRTAERIDKVLQKTGWSLEPEADEPPPQLLLDEPGLAACYAAAALGIGVSGERAGLPALRLVFGQPAPERPESGSDEPVAEHRGVNVHPKQWLDGRDRQQLERLCRYITRPPVAQADPSPVEPLTPAPRGRAQAAHRSDRARAATRARRSARARDRPGR